VYGERVKGSGDNNWRFCQWGKAGCAKYKRPKVIKRTIYNAYPAEAIERGEVHNIAELLDFTALVSKRRVLL
jgi:hypothetical protein